MQKINIAIDGVSGSGKGTTARELAKKLNYKHIDTGLFYRSIAYYLDQKDISEKDINSKILNSVNITVNKDKTTIVNGEKLDYKQLRSSKTSLKASKISAMPLVRSHVVSLSREIALKKGVIMEGRATCYEELPDAQLKIYLNANLEIRAIRRKDQLKEKGILSSISEIEQELAERDHNDSTRAAYPLQRHPQAIEIDTSNITIDEQVEVIYNLAQKLINKND